jgi:hypothetical protein
MSLPPPPAPPVGGRAARRQAAEAAAREQSRQRSRTLMAVGAVLVGVVLLGGLAFWLTHRSGSGTPGAAPSPSDSALRQPTMLFQIRDQNAIAVDNTILAVGGPQDNGISLMVPQSLILDVPTGGPLPLGQVARLPDASASADALHDLLGIRVDSTFSLDRLAFAGLVDAVGGVTANVDTNVVTTKPDGSQVVTVAAGERTLDGLDATAYATYLAPGEPEQARMQRFDEILQLVLQKLPADANQIEPILNSLGSLARSTVPSSQVATFLARFRGEITAGDVQAQNVPTTTIDSGGGSNDIVRIDSAAAATMINTLLPDAIVVPGPNSKVRVLVQNGVLVPGLGQAARALLVDAGYTYLSGGNAGQLNTGPTAIVVPDASAQSVQWGTGIAKALGVPSTDVQTPRPGDEQSIANVVVVLGKDFVPKSSG